MELKEYLKQRHTESTTKRYYIDILSYLDKVTQQKALTATYGDIMNYIGELRKKYSNPETVRCNLQAIKKYYAWLIHTGQRKGHPCRNLNLKDKTNRDVQLQDLFTSQELELTDGTERAVQGCKDKKPGNHQFIDLPGLNNGRHREFNT